MDDLLDLNFSSPPKPITSSATTSNVRPGNSSGHSGSSKPADAFDFLLTGSRASNSTPAPPPVRLATPTGILSPNTLNGSRTQPVFSSTPLMPSAPAITRPGSTTSNGNVSNAARSPHLGSVTRQSTPSNLKPIATSLKPASNSKADAFGDLFAMSGASVAQTQSLADRQAQLAREKKEQEEKERKQFDFENGAFWDKMGSGGQVPLKGRADGMLDMFGASGPSLSNERHVGVPSIVAPQPQRAHPTPSQGKGSFWNSDFSASTSRERLSGDMKTETPVPRVGSSAPPLDPFDFESLSSTVPSHTGHVRNGEFDDDESDLLGGFGSRSVRGDVATPSDPTARVEGADTGDDDLLGVLGRPMRKASPPRTVRPSASSKKVGSTRATSPPPHIIGQIVEMGFSPIQARSALDRTANGVDVQAALEMLLSSNMSASESSTLGQTRTMGSDDEADADFVAQQRRRRQLDAQYADEHTGHDAEAREAERRRARRAGPSRSSVQPRSSGEQLNQNKTSNLDSFDTDKYMQQASATYTSMLGKASTLWAAGKERAAKILEEQKKNLEVQQKALREGQGKRDWDGRDDGRPRWMVEGERYGDNAGEERDERPSKGQGGGFKDDSDDEGDGVLAAHPSERRQRQGGHDSPAAETPGRPSSKAPTNQEDAYRSVKERADLLFADEQPKYVSAHRRKAPARDNLASSSAASSRPASAPPRRAATPLIKRTLVIASPSAVSSAAEAKNKGNEHFKLGRYSEAETSYTSAISRLPPGHLHLVALYNNRATVRLKSGEGRTAAEDCSSAIEIIGPSYHPSKEEAIDDKEVRLAEGLVKAYMKRAQAFEMQEKYDKAIEDWEKVVALAADAAFASGASSKTALEGVRRARKALSGGGKDTATSGPVTNQSGVATKAVPQTAGRPSTSRPTASSRIKAMTTENSTAVASLRSAAAAAAKEDDQKLALRDGVNARVDSWKAGKETNLRALIASLETVLWSEIMNPPGGGTGLKVGMHELISEKQVKVRYMRVAGRLHPDKLNANNTSVEQRMIANAVFGVLSEAWAAFQTAS